MRSLRRLVASTVALLVAGVLAPTTPAAGLTATVSHVSVAPSSVTVDGLGDALVTVQVDIDEPRGTPMGSGQDDAYCGVGSCAFGRVSPFVRGGVLLAEVPGTRVGSTATYRGSWLVSSTFAGTYLLTDVGWYVDGSNLAWTDVDLTSTPLLPRQVAVTGTHVPTVAAQLIPAVVAYGGRQWAQLTFRRSDGSPIVGRYADWCYGYGCFRPWGPPTASTDARGRVVVRLPAGEFTVARLAAPSTAQPGSWVTVFEVDGQRHQYFRTVTPSARSAVRRGRTITVRVLVDPGYGATVSLQRLVGRHWRTVANAPVRSSGAAFLTTVSVLGRQYFRARAAGGFEMAPTSSRPFVVIGTRR